MSRPVSINEKLTVQVEDTKWLVHIGNVSEGIVGVRAFPEKEGAPTEPNIYWDFSSRNFDEIPRDVPTKVRTAIYQWMRMFHPPVGGSVDRT